MEFAAAFIALYVGHHIGDYWVQTDAQARTKGAAGWAGRLACLAHVGTYLATQAILLIATSAVIGQGGTRFEYAAILGLFISGVTHYTADRREHGLMFWLAKHVPGKVAFLRLGVPRREQLLEFWGPCSTCEGRGTSYDESTGGKCWDCRAGGMLPSHVVLTDNPSLGTGVWALDQAWHIALGCFVPALIIAGLS